jgi:RNA polymerase sigma-70 factor (ECF subfamily)
MGRVIPKNSDTPEGLFRRAAAGDERALSELFAGQRDRLRLMVRLRLDRRPRGRLDASDVVQEAYVEALGRIAAYAADPDMPFFLCLRFLTAQKLLVLHRRHLGAQARNASRELSLAAGLRPFPSRGRQGVGLRRAVAEGR